jgi:acetyl-CoA carboxylase carboxyltransferase component
MPWEDELRRLDEDREAFREFDEARSTAPDRLTPRQRVETLLDAGSFLEVAARARDGAPGGGIVAGFGTIAARAVGVVSEDPLALASSDGEVGKNKVLRVLMHAYQGRLPVIYLADGPSGASALAAREESGLPGRYSDRQLVMPDLHLERRESPLVVAACGPVRQEARSLAAAADLVIERRDALAPRAATNGDRESSGLRLASAVASSSAPVSASASMSTSSSTRPAGAGDRELADLVVASDEEAVAVVLRFLSLAPPSSGAPLARSAESAAWGTARRLRDDVDPAALSCRELLSAVLDQHSALVFDAAGDPSLFGGLGRVGGYPVAFMIGGADAEGIGESRLRRLLRVARVAARLRLPIVFLQHGAAYSLEAIESPRAIERLAELLVLIHDLDVPKLCVVSGRGHVLGDFVLGGRELGSHYVAAWAQARVGVDDVPAFTVEIACGDGPEGPWQAAGRGLLDDVILPGETPARLAAMLRLLAPSRALPPPHLASDRRIALR